jgi:hypothetical protein
MRRQNPLWAALPVASGEREEAVPHAWRSPWIGGSARQ